MSATTQEQSWWRRQLAAWSEDKQTAYRTCCESVAAEHPTWDPSFVEFAGFRKARDLFLAEGTLVLEQVWDGASGHGRSWQEIQDLPKDDSAQRLDAARREWEENRRAAANDTESK